MTVHRLLVERLGAEGGGVVVLVGLLMPFLLLLGSFSVDVGNWWVHKRHLQLQADAAALAGGALFGACFVDATAGSAAMEAEATKYGGGPGSVYNGQVGNANKGTVTLRYQSKTFEVGGPPADDTEEDPACETPSLMFDVKATEAGLPMLFNIPGLSFVPAVNAHARVQLRKATILRGSLPLAVPQVRPKHVTATFVDKTGAVVAGPVSLTGPTALGSLNAWTGSAPVVIPAGAIVGVRIGVGQVAGTCAAANKTGGTGFVCYDYSGFDTGLATIAGYSTGATPAAPSAQAFEVTPATACSASPFFSDEHLTAGATTCSASVQAVVHVAGLDPAKVKTFNAKVTGPGFNVTRPLTFAGGTWSTGYVFDLPVDTGAYDIALEWQYEGGSKASYPLVQRLYSAHDDSGPVKALTLTGASGAAYALPAGSQTVTVNVALEGTLQLTPSGEMVMLRLTGGSRTSALACDGPGANEFKDAVIRGCLTPYQINSAGFCPNPTPPSGPADCVPTQTGTMAGPTLAGLDTRFATCPAYQYPTYPVGDPRIVKLLITDFSALGGSGTTEVPVTDIAVFYVAGWTASKCATNTPPPFDVKKGAIWGHFIKYAAPDPNSTATEACDPDAITPCIPVMTR